MPITPSSDTWQPPEAKRVKLAMNIGIGAVAITAAAYGITRFVPTWIDALNLIQKLFESGVNVIIAGGVLTFVAWVAYETFSPSGSINKLFSQAYNSMINNLTWQLLEVDPISPLIEERDNMVKRKSIFDEAFAKFDGMLQSLRQTEEEYRTNARKADQRAQAANKAIATDPTMEATRRSLNYEAGRYNESADGFAAMQARLIPVRDTIAKLRESLIVMLSNIEIDIDIAKREWAAQQKMAEMDKSARGILQRKQQLAMDARQIIKDKYASQIGRLENLKDITKPLLDSISLDHGTYDEAAMANWQQEANATLRLAAPGQSPMSLVGLGQGQKVPVGSKIGGLIR